MTAPDAWTIVNTRHDAHSLGQHNSVFTISNGYVGIKGNLAEDRDGYSPVTIINGVYDELDMFSLIRASNEPRRYLDERHFDTAGKSPAVANLPNPLFLRVFVGEREISLARGQISDFGQVLTLRDGLYTCSFTYRDAAGHTTRLTAARFAPIQHPHRVYARYGITPLDHDAPIRVQIGICGAVHSNTTRERQFHVTGMSCEPVGRCALHARTIARGITVQMITADALRGDPMPDSARGVIEHDTVYTEYMFTARRGQRIGFDRALAVASPQDNGVDLASELDSAIRQGFDAALEEQRRAWAELWDACDVEIEGDETAQRYLRFCLYHLLAAAPRHTDRLSVPVKLLTGEYYQGNTFYDTDVYILPFYTFTQPAIARTCLNWRHAGLGPGREIARELGYAGAKFAWQAGPEGEECLGKWWHFTHRNIHINGDVAYALMQYGQATGDEAFMAGQGADILVECARFYASRARYDAARGAYDLADVAGPDEGHCESTNNFYTNYLARRTLEWAAQVLDDLARRDPEARARCDERLRIGAAEPRRWRHVAERLTFLYDPNTRVYEQCEGFYRLEPLPPELSRDRKVWFATVAPYQALNQPDVLMAMAMFRDAFPADVVKANYDFYYAKSMNFSSMSFVINAIMAAEVGDLDEAYQQFLVSAGSDLDEELTGRKDTYAGLHGTAAGGAWMAAVMGFGGVRLSERGLAIRPRLPRQWKSLQFRLAYRGRTLRVRVDHEQVTLQAEPGPVELEVCGRTVSVAASPVAVPGR